MKEPLEVIRNLSQTVNAPFFREPIVKLLLREIENRLRFSGSPEVDISSDRLAIYVRIRKGGSKTKIVLMAHLDHPAIIFKRPGFGQPVGDILSNGTSQLNTDNELPIRLYDPRGKQIGVSKVIRENESFALEGIEKINANTIGVWDLPDFSTNGEYLEMRACDNLVSVGVLISVATQILDDESDCDLILLFPFVEEVLQLSMVGIAHRGRMPIAELDRDTVYISVDVSSLRSSTETTYYKQYNLKRPNKVDGPLIQVADTDLVFGVLSGEDHNLAETLLERSASDIGIPHQHTICMGRSDLTPLALYTTYPNMAGLLIPCSNIHNIDDMGNLSCERVFIEDIERAIKILIHLIKIAQVPSGMGSRSTLSGILRNTEFTDFEELYRMRRRWLNAYQTNVHRLQGEFFFPRNYTDVLRLLTGKASAALSLSRAHK